MNPRDPFDIWRAERQSARIPDGFADRVMEAIGDRRPGLRAAKGTSPRGSTSRVPAAVTLAAGVCVAVAWHVAFVGAVLLSLPGMAR